MTAGKIRLLLLALLAVPAPLLLGPLPATAQELLVGLGAGRGEAARPVVLGEPRRGPLVGPGPVAPRTPGDQPRDRPDEREQQHEEDPAQLGQVAHVALVAGDRLDQAVEPQDRADGPDDDVQAQHQEAPPTCRSTPPVTPAAGSSTIRLGDGGKRF